MSQVFNKSKVSVENAKKAQCPRCKGFSAVFPRDKEDHCDLCEGKGELWISIYNTGWTRALWKRLGDSKLY